MDAKGIEMGWDSQFGSAPFNPSLRGGQAGILPSSLRVALMVTCLNDVLFPDVGRAVVTLLRRLGISVDFPAKQTCCAQPMINTGYLDEAVPLVQNFADAFADYDYIVSPSASCVGTVRHQHALVADRTHDEGLESTLADLSPRVVDLTEFLVDVLGIIDVGASFPHTVAYHPTCHSLRLLGLGARPWRLLHAVRGIQVVDLPGADACCGFGGTFAVKNADTSVAIGTDKIRNIVESGADVVVAVDSSCLMHIRGLLSRHGSSVQVAHLAEVLAS